MNREQQLFFCKKCKHRDFNITKGLLCKHTGKAADFEKECPKYELDKTTIVKLAPKKVIKSNSKRATMAQNLIWAVLIIDLISMVSSYMQYDILSLLQKDMFVFDGALENNDNRVAVVALLYSITYIISVVTFIMWFRRAYYNLSTRVKIQYDEGWAAGSWFVPIISLYRPYKIMIELFERTNYLLRQRSQLEIKDDHNSLIGLWWGIWLITNYIGKYAFKKAFGANTIEALMNSTMADIIMSIVNIPLGLLVIFLIKSFNKKEEHLLELESKAMDDHQL